MGRRKKEPGQVHREAIAAAAGHLFTARGTGTATMDDIAKEAGYSKATLYVYFANKEDIISFLVLKSMKMLHQSLSQAVSGPGPAREKYGRICAALEQYQENNPLYFSFVLREIKIDAGAEECLPSEKETYETGEEINQVLASFIREGIDSGAFRSDIPILETVFLFWSTLSGLIQMAASKQRYIEKTMHMSKRQFLDFGYGQLYLMIKTEEIR